MGPVTNTAYFYIAPLMTFAEVDKRCDNHVILLHYHIIYEIRK